MRCRCTGRRQRRTGAIRWPAPRLLALALADSGAAAGEALRWIAEALKRAPKSSQMHAAHGRILVGQGALAQARAAFEIALRHDPAWIPAHRALVQLCLRDGAAAALAPLQRAADALPAEVWPQAELGRLLAQLRQYVAAVQHLRRAVQRAPRAAVLHYDLGAACQECDDMPAAIAAYGAAISLDPAMVRAHHNLGSALQASGAMSAALASYARALALDPASFGRVARDLAAGPRGQVFLRAADLRARLTAAL